MKKKPSVPQPLHSRPPLERMFRIFQEIKKGDFPNCHRLGRQLEVSDKTVQRDIDFMRDRLGVPLEYDRRRYGFYFTQPVTNFPMFQASEGELVALFVAQKALALYRGTPFERPLHAAFEKLTSGLTDHLSFSWSELDSAISFRTIGTTEADLDLFDQLSQAVVHSKEMTFEYRKLSGASFETRRVHPYHLGSVENQWYLFGLDLDRQQIRTFALPRIRKVAVSSRTFLRPAEFSVTKHLGGSFGVFTSPGHHEVRIRFDDFAARLVRERTWHASQKIKELDRGGIELSLKLGSLPEVERWILSWGAHARVLAPRALKESVVRTLKRMLASY